MKIDRQAIKFHGIILPIIERTTHLCVVVTPSRIGMTPGMAAQREWLRQWKEAGPALAARRREELLHLSDERALAASEALLSLVGTVTLSLGRLRWSGLVEQQALLHRRLSP